MTPELRTRLTAQNETRPAFGQVVADAKAAAGSIETSSTRASAAATRQSGALTVLARSSAQAANQQRNLVFQLNDTAVSLAGGMNPLMVLAQQGSQIATIYGPEEGGLGRALKETGNLALGLVTKFWPVTAAVAAGSAAIAGMTAEINKAGEQQVSFGDVAMATWQLFAEGIYSLVQPAITAIAGWLGDMWDMAWPILKAAGNAIIATFVGAFDATVSAWSAFPAVMGDLVYSAVNASIDGVELLINGTIDRWNEFQRLLGLEGNTGHVDFAGVDNPYGGAMSGVAQDVVDSFQGAFGIDHLGGMFDAIKGRAQSLAAAADEAGTSLKGANDNLKPLNLGLEAANDNAEKLGETLASSLTDGVMSIWQAFRSGDNVLEAITDQLMNFADQLLSNTVSGFLGGILGGGGMLSNSLNRPGNFSIGNMASYANGTSFHGGGMALIGERGPELLSLPRGSRVSTAEQTASMLGGGVTVNIINPPSPPQIAQNSDGGIDVMFSAVEQRIKGNMAKGQYRQFGVSPGMRRT